MIWTPPGSPQSRRAQLPGGDVALSDGRTLLRIKSRLRSEATFTTDGGMAVIATIDNTPHGVLLHVSVSYPDHAPTWEEIRLVKSAFFGEDLDAMMVLPREADYVNVHPYCFHLWQMPVRWGLR